MITDPQTGYGQELHIAVNGTSLIHPAATSISGNYYHITDDPYTGSWILTRKEKSFDGLRISADGKMQLPVHLTQTSQ